MNLIDRSEDLLDELEKSRKRLLKNNCNQIEVNAVRGHAYNAHIAARIMNTELNLMKFTKLAQTVQPVVKTNYSRKKATP